MKRITDEELNVLLVSFNFCRKDENPDPYGISCLKTAFNLSVCKRPGDRIKSLVIDLNERVWTDADVLEKIISTIREEKSNVVALSDFIWSDRYIRHCLGSIRREFPFVFISLGGPMVAGTEQILKEIYPEVDLFVKSFGEKVFGNLRRYIDSGKVFVEELPAFSLLESPYVSGEIAVGKDMSVRMETRRGCPFNCSYCRHRNSNCHVYKMEEFVRQERELQIFKDAEVRKINVLDPFFNDINNFDMNKARGLQFLKKCREMKVSAELSLQIRPEMLNENYLEFCADMKNVTYEIGIQSLDVNVFPKIRRGNEKALPVVKDRLRRVKSAGINTEITLIYGLPDQTYESFARDVEYLKKMGFKKISAFPLQIYPETGIIQDYRKYGLKVEKVEPFGILQVYDNPQRDFIKMSRLAETI